MRWTEIEQSDRWKTMTADQRRVAREKYFDEFVVPKAPDRFDPAELREKWMSYSDRDEAANLPGARGPESRGGERLPMDEKAAFVSQANAAIQRGVPMAEVRAKAESLKAFDKGDRPFDDLSERARAPRGGKPMGYVSSQDEIDEATLSPKELLDKRQAEYLKTADETAPGSTFLDNSSRDRIDRGFAQMETEFSGAAMSNAVGRWKELEANGDLV